VDGQGVHWTSHLSRLRLGAIKLGWDVSWLDGTGPQVAAWMAAAGPVVGRMQLLPDALSVRLEAIPDHVGSYGLLAMGHPLGDIRSDSRSAHKGLLGAWDIEARNQAKAKLADDALLLWPDGTLSETAIAAIGLQVAGKLRMPPKEGRVASIAEAIELPLWASSRGLEVRYGPIRLDEVSTGQLWCMNAVRGLWQAEVVQL